MTRSTQTLLVILIAILAAALVIAIALLFQDEPPPNDTEAKYSDWRKPVTTRKVG